MSPKSPLNEQTQLEVNSNSDTDTDANIIDTKGHKRIISHNHNTQDKDVLLLCIVLLLANDQFCFQGLLFLIKLYCHLGHKILLQSHFVGMRLKWNIASTLILSSFPGGIWLMKKRALLREAASIVLFIVLHILNC